MHEGHRARMREKLENDASSLFDHELLEILLFYAYPRINTNGIAHDLINAFGSLSGVFNASAEELKHIKSVGANTAVFLKCMGEINRRINGTFNGVALLKSYEDFKKFTALRMKGRVEENLEIYCLEKNGKVKRIFSYTSNEVNKVVIDTQKITKAIALSEPYGLIIAHNHLTGSAEPSDNDDRFTAEAQVICSMNNVNLYDHCIFAADGSVYSYFCAGKIDMINKNSSFNKLVDNQFRKDTTENNFKK